MNCVISVMWLFSGLIGYWKKDIDLVLLWCCWLYGLVICLKVSLVVWILIVFWLLLWIWINRILDWINICLMLCCKCLVCCWSVWLGLWVVSWNVVKLNILVCCVVWILLIWCVWLYWLDCIECLFMGWL